MRYWIWLSIFISLNSVVASDPMAVFVSVQPQAYFVERIAGDLVKIGVLVNPGQSPHTYEPTPKQIAELIGAKIFFSIGLPFEERILSKIKALDTHIEVINSSAGIPVRTFKEDEAEDEARGPTEEHRHEHSSGTPDPHIWMNPRYVKIQAGTIVDALTRLDPDHAGSYQMGYDAFIRELDELDRSLTQLLTPFKGKEFMVFHPSFGYFADAYGLKQHAIEIEGKEPTSRQLVQLIDTAKSSNCTVIFTQPQFSPKSAQAVAEAIRGTLVPLDALSKDYMTNMKLIGTTLEKAWKDQVK